nr:glycoside hydrolase family 30 beta sandwich domain-containing protein [Prolixibacteraceae bacterium]
MTDKRVSIIITGLVIIFLQVGNVHAQNIIIDPDSIFQNIRGFGGMNHTTWINDLNEDNRNKAFGNDPGEMGLSILRIHLDPNPALFSRELPTALHALREGAIVFASPWNAPDNLLEPVGSIRRVNPGKYAEYVAHLNAFNQYMADNGAPLFAISVQNEPDYGEWTRWSSGEMLDFMANYAQDIENRVIAPESFQFRRTYTDPLLNNSAAAQNLDIVGGHIYGGGLADYPLARQKGKEVWMTEHLLGSNANETNDWSLALVVAKEINDCMKANFNAYIWWYIRRFYGLIADDGNITDKGYVLAHYAKFIRPGAVRIFSDDRLVSLVDITAFKTDTSLVMVLLNRSTGSKQLNITIENANITTWSRFTSTAVKKMVNEGEFPITDGTFSVTIEPRSVTTFTTVSAPGGKFGNIPPEASVGEMEEELFDETGSGEVAVTLQGSNSHDPDGEIVYFSWAQNGIQISTQPDLEQKLGIGNHSFVLTVTDNDGATNTDTVQISVVSNNNAHIWLEAECTEVGENWDVLSGRSSSNDAYLSVKPGIQALNAASGLAADLLTYTFLVPEHGNYKIWGRVLVPSANDDSYWIKVDNGSWINWNSIVGGSSWQWDDVHNQSNDSPMVYALDSGMHTLSLCYREDGASIDKFYLTNTGATPSGMG